VRLLHVLSQLPDRTGSREEAEDIRRREWRVL